METHEGVIAKLDDWEKASHMKVEHCELPTLHLVQGLYRILYMK